MGRIPTLLAADVTSSTGVYGGLARPATVFIQVIAGAAVIFTVYLLAGVFLAEWRERRQPQIFPLRISDAVEATEGRVRRRPGDESGRASLLVLAFVGSVVVIAILAGAVVGLLAGDSDVTGAEVPNPPPTSASVPVTTSTTAATTTTTLPPLPEVYLADDDRQFFGELADLTGDPWLDYCLSDQSAADGCAELAYMAWDAITAMEVAAVGYGWDCDDAGFAITEFIGISLEEGNSEEDAVALLAAALVTWLPDGYFTGLIFGCDYGVSA